MLQKAFYEKKSSPEFFQGIGICHVHVPIVKCFIRIIFFAPAEMKQHFLPWQTCIPRNQSFKIPPLFVQIIFLETWFKIWRILSIQEFIKLALIHNFDRLYQIRKVLLQHFHSIFKLLYSVLTRPAFFCEFLDHILIAWASWIKMWMEITSLPQYFVFDTFLQSKDLEKCKMQIWSAFLLEIC